MSAVLHKLSPQEVQARLAAGRAVLVDIREPDEFARANLARRTFATLVIAVAIYILMR